MADFGTDQTDTFFRVRIYLIPRVAQTSVCESPASNGGGREKRLSVLSVPLLPQAASDRNGGVDCKDPLKTGSLQVYDFGIGPDA